MKGELERSLQRLMLGVRADWALYVKYSGTGEEICFNADTMMDTMSTIKIPILVTMYRMADAGQLDLAQKLTLETRFKRFGTGALQYMDEGMVFSLRDAATLMIIESDNTATDYCYDAVGGPDAVNRTMRELGLRDIDVMGTGFEWFSALAGSIDPQLGELGPAELFHAGYPDLSPAQWIAARERFHFEVGRPFSRATARAHWQLAGHDLERQLCQSAVLCRDAPHLAFAGLALALAQVSAGSQSRAQDRRFQSLHRQRCRCDRIA